MDNNNICNVCGANYIFKNDMWECPACGNFKPIEITKEEMVLLWNASAQLRRANFQDAEELYTDFIAKYPENAEGYWGRLLARYGIKYEDDIGGKKVPTIYAMSIESVIGDRDYSMAIARANGALKEYYKREAAKFEQIRVEWQDKASKEAPVDIFISFKDSDTENNIDRTDDSYEAQGLYQHLRDLGYNVFFSRESLRDKLAEKFEPYIFNALNTARVMIVYSRKKEYLESTWVKNEWLRFTKKIKSGEKEKNSLILAYEKMSPKEFPTAFKNLQCMDASKKTFYGDLDKHIAKLLRKDEPLAPQQQFAQPAPVIQQKVRNTRSKRVEDPQTKTAFIYLSKGLYDEVESSFAEALTKNPNNAEALFGDIILRLKTSDDNEPTRVVDGVNVYDDINIAAASVDSTKGLLYADNIFNSLTRNLASAEDANFAKSIAVFDSLLQLVNSDECEDYSKNLYGVAKDCQARKMFGKAKSYYDIMISSGENVGEAYWGLLQLNLNAVDDDALISQSTLITTFPEFNSAMAYAEGDTAVNRYLSVKSKQIEYIAKQKADELARIERERAEEAAKIARAKAAEEAKRTKKENDRVERENAARKRKNRDRKLISICTAVVVSLILIITLSTVLPAQARISVTYEASPYGYIVTGKVVEKSKKVVIKDTYKGKPVVGISPNAFKDDKVLESITLPNTIKSIDKEAFSGCVRLTSITIPDSVTSIGESAFRYCALKSITIPNSVTSIGDYAFEQCGGLTSITIPNSVTSIGDYAFEWCSGLKSITIPNSVTSIGNSTFRNCRGLTSIAIPDSVTSIGDYAFELCIKLTSITIPSSVTSIVNSTFRNCSGLTSITIPYSVTSIGDYAFYDCSGLTSITIPNSVTNIGSSVFSGCSGLTSITIPNSVTSLGSWTFTGWTYGQTIHIKGYASTPRGWSIYWDDDCKAKICWNCKH